MKKGLIFTAILALVPALGFSQEGSAGTTAWQVNNTASWIAAVNGVRNGGASQVHTITVTGTMSVPASPDKENTFGALTGITVTIEGSGTLSLSSNGSLLVIGKDQIVVAKDLTLKGRDANNASVVNILSGGTFRMEGKATITGNKTNGSGGGVFVNERGTFTMQDSATVSGNTANSDSGGGVYVNGGTFTMQDSASVSGNTAYYRGGVGGGVYVRSGSFTMSSGTISGNTASYNGGGVYIHDGTFTIQGGTISGNTASYNGGGVSLYDNMYGKGTFTMQGGTISGNTAKLNGGGVYSVEGGTFTMSGGTISGNAANNGGGVYSKGSYDNRNFSMQGGTVSGNTASYNGGGVYVDHGTFTMQDSASVSGNTSSSGGGGVYVGSGTFNMRNDVSISGNKSDRDGGGVYVNERGTFAKAGGTIYGNDAEQDLKNTAGSGKGHAVYEDKNKGWRNASADWAMIPDGYGFWLNEEVVPETPFPSGFGGTWKRSNFNNTLTFTGTTVKSSSRDVLWKFISVSGNSYTMEANTAARTRLTLTIRLVNDNIEISGDSGSGENNWNGTWRKQ